MITANKKLKTLAIIFLNVLPVVSQIVLMLLVTPVLSNRLDTETFGLWNIIQQVGALIFSIVGVVQVVLSKQIARIHSAGDVCELQQYLLAVAPLIGRIMIGVIAISAGLAYILPILLSNIPEGRRTTFALSIFTFGCGASFNVLFVFLSGYAQGLSKNLFASSLNIVSKIMLGLGWVVICRTTADLFHLSLVFLVVAIIVGKIALVPFRKYSVLLKNIFGLITSKLAVVTFRDSMYLIIWTVSMMFVSGFGTFLVAKYDYPQVKSFSLPFTLVSGVNAIFGAVSNILIPVCSSLSVNRTASALGDFVINATAIFSSIIILMSVPLVLYGDIILNIWIGSNYCADMVFALSGLAIANLIRMTATPYAIAVIGAGAQRKMLVTPCLEGLLTFTLSLVLVRKFGMPGVVYGMICGAVIAVCGNFFVNFRYINEVTLDLVKYLRCGLFYPSSLALPFIFLKINRPDNLTLRILLVGLMVFLFIFSLVKLLRLFVEFWMTFLTSSIFQKKLSN